MRGGSSSSTLSQACFQQDYRLSSKAFFQSTQKTSAILYTFYIAYYYLTSRIFSEVFQKISRIQIQGISIADCLIEMNASFMGKEDKSANARPCL